MTHPNPDVQKLIELVRIPSFNVLFDKESGGPNYQATKDALKYLKSVASSADHFMVEFDEYPEFPKKVPNLVSVWQKGEYIPGVTKCLLVSGHVDVVLANPAEWSHPPFEGAIVDDYIIGRGVTDMKGGTMSLVLAAERAMADPAIESMVIIGVFTGDEEAMALNGAKHAFKWVSENFEVFKPDAALIAEPASNKVFGDQYGDGRPGLLGGYLDFTGISGHSGAGNFINPVTLGCNVMAGLEAHEFEPHPDPAWTHRTSFQPMSAQAAHLFNVNLVPGSAAFAWSIRFTPIFTAPELTKLVKDKTQRIVRNVAESWARRGMPFPDASITVLTNYEQKREFEKQLQEGRQKPT
ncbi:MAG: M20/M25/M40 family metallo-hydrolase, partial [Alphaproteobacteria bacterium]